jgi:hypothetical protein
MNKKILKLALAILTLTVWTAGLSTAMAVPLDNHNLMTRVVLDPNLKPDNSPGVIIGTKTLQAAGAEAAFGNYVLQIIAGGLITVAAPVAIIIIAISGLIAVVSHGDQALIDKARKTLTWAIIGLIVIIFSWVIVKAVISVVISANSNPATQTSTTDTGAKQGQENTAPLPPA